ncbi:hypothetical protein C1701_14440 [Actinoalloteichus sp. AHMU CJ021]|uniref:Uncharacterized protein n=1 Tax=Actinoalloteichus caeruleus DSM 43889 TaxID=1120930 RepID=A0ABT1JM96_ACTCY|nr:hypothetical protein [Actinoalloteichus caeruleus]AUS79362.1 hypothetical protein C1701_14440 [Actinoalloteichus sp. AHMU CJ021]MCP2333654.1 hypothetical protein [Actinoalloteichus caeruleus DSM 43889]
MPQLVIMALVAVGSAIAAIVQRRRDRRLAAELSAWAAQHGWVYQPDDQRWVGRFQGPPFNRGFGRAARHVLVGRHRGWRVAAFQYVYKEKRGSGKNRRTVTITNLVACASAERRIPWPSLQIGREHFGHRLLNLFGGHDLRLESEDFNRTFRINTVDDKFAYDVLHPRTMEWMLADARAVRFPLRFENVDLVTWESGTLDLPRATSMLDYLVDFLERVPQFVWNDGGDGYHTPRTPGTSSGPPPAAPLPPPGIAGAPSSPAGPPHGAAGPAPSFDPPAAPATPPGWHPGHPAPGAPGAAHPGWSAPPAGSPGHPPHPPRW